MRPLTREEAAQIRTKPDGRASYVRVILLAMNVGEIILLEPKDWTQRTQVPKTYCRQLGNATGREWTCKKAIDGSGWVIERVK